MKICSLRCEEFVIRGEALGLSQGREQGGVGEEAVMEWQFFRMH